MKLREKTTATLLIAIFMISTFAVAIPIVSADTHDVYDGQSIQYAIDAADPGDTVLVHPGTYDSIVIDESLMVRSTDGATVTIIDAQLTDFGVFIIGATTTATFEGFTVRNYEVGGILAGAFSPTEEDPFVVHILNNVVEDPSTLEDAHNNNIQVADGTTGTIIGNEVFGAHLEDPDWSGSGIIVASSNDVLISNNYAYSCDIGIAIIGYTHGGRAPSEGNIIEYNFVEDCGAGIGVQRQSIDTIIRYNDLSSNDVGIESAGYPGDVPSGTEIHYNNIVDNTEFGVTSIIWGEDPGDPEQIDATLNWWGDASGPSGVGPGSGDTVSTYVDYSPWLGATFETIPRTYHVNPTGTIQAAIDAATAGDSILVAAGTYDEQVAISKSLTLEGTGDTTIIKPSGPELTATASIPWIGGNPSAMSAIVSVVTTGGEVTLKDLKIDASLITSKSTLWLGGLVYLETSGTVEGLTVIGNPALPDRTAGIFAAAVTYTANLEITGCTVEGYNRAGIYALGGEFTADYHHNEINGPGAISGGVPNGMFFLEGAKGSATYNTVTDLGYTGEEYRSTGIGTYNAGVDIVFSHNEISLVQNAFALSTGTIGTIVEYNDIHDCHTGVRIEAGAEGSLIQYNEIYDNDFAIRCGPEMGDGNVAHYNNLFNNPGLEWTNEGEGCTYIGAVCNLHETYTLDATLNWWGQTDGPGPVGPGSGDTVSTCVDYYPWLPFEVTQVPPTIPEAVDFIEAYVDHRGLANSLISKLENVKDNNYENVVNAFINELEAIGGKKVDAEIADILIAWAMAWSGP